MKPLSDERVDAVPAQRSMTRGEVSLLPWMALVWLRNLKEPDCDPVEARVRGFTPPYVNLLLPSGEVVSVEFEDENPDMSDVDNRSAAISDGGEWMVVELIDVQARIAAEAERLEAVIEQQRESLRRVS